MVKTNGVSKSLRVEKRINKRKNGGLMKKVVNYLLSDSYMYAPLVSSPKTKTTKTKSPSTGLLGYIRKAISAKKKPKKKHVQIREQQQAEKTSDLHVNDSAIYGVDGLQRSPLGRHEKVKHMVHYSTRILSSPDRGNEKNLFTEFKKKPALKEFVTTRFE